MLSVPQVVLPSPEPIHATPMMGEEVKKKKFDHIEFDIEWVPKEDEEEEVLEEGEVVMRDQRAEGSRIVLPRWALVKTQVEIARLLGYSTTSFWRRWSKAVQHRPPEGRRWPARSLNFIAGDFRRFEPQNKDDVTVNLFVFEQMAERAKEWMKLSEQVVIEYN